ncbi:MAG TPA: hypothetical protein VIL51_12310 [Thermoleophilia bacterium]
MKVATPVRAIRTFTQHLLAPPEDVFPLLCPVREAEWAHDWAPTTVHSYSGVAEQDCVFVTPSEAGDEVWMITRHEPERWLVEMVMVAPSVVTNRLTIGLRPCDDGCLADVCYRKTSLGPAGDEEIAQLTEAAWAAFMTTWEQEMNDYLQSGAS